ncbi:MAG: hypothetical protein QM601_06080 [Pseudoxanthomonas sp.]
MATAVGWATFTRPVLMWALTFTLMPLIFVALAYWYFRGVRPAAAEAAREALKLTLLWIAISFAMDALVFIAVIPLAFGAAANWTFFVDQSPWIWLCYAVLVPIVFAGLHLYRRWPPTGEHA